MLRPSYLLLVAVAALAQQPDEPRRIRLATEQMTRSRFGLSDSHSFQLRTAFTDRAGRLHVRYRQLYRGVPVRGAGAIAHLDEHDRFLDPTARIFADIDVPVSPALDEPALRQRYPEIQRAELAIVPDRVLVFTEDPAKRVLPQVPAIEEFSWVNRGYWLAWYARTEEEALLVDAQSGEIQSRYSLRAAQGSPVRTPAPATGQSALFGPVRFDASRNEETGLFELTDPRRGGNTVSNLDGAASVRSSVAKPFTSASNAWGDGLRLVPGTATSSPNGQTLGVDTAFAIERAYDYLRNVHGHAGPDGKGSPVEARVHFGASSSAEAFWHRGAGAAFFGSQTPDAETIWHELGHAIWFAFNDSDGGETSEADGIGQGNADIFASLVEFYHLGAGGRGASLADVEAGWNWRARMLNGQQYWSVDAPRTDEHVLGALYGRIFVSLARGGTSRFLPGGSAGLGVQAAAGLWYLATVAYLPDEPSFFDLREAYLRAAAVLFGEGSTQQAVVRNAFAGAGLGAPVTDAAAPGVTSLRIEQIDEGEGSAFVTTAADDDSGVMRVEFVVNGQTLLTRARPPYSGFIDISRLGPGNHTLLARAVDPSGKVGLATVPFALKGVTQLVRDGGFEGAADGWTVSGAGIQSGADAFLGARHALFATPGASISQRIAIPSSATAAELTFRLRIDDASEIPTGSRLELRVGDDLLTTFFDDANNSPGRYIRQSFNLIAYRGRTVDLRFAASPAGTVRFLVDNVSLVVAEPAAVEVSAEVDDGEQSLILRLPKLTGLRPEQISRVDYVASGEVVGSAARGDYSVVRSTQGLIRRTYSLVAAVYDPAGTKIVESPPVSYTLREVNQVVNNGGFERGGTGWFTLGQTFFPRDPDPAATNTRAFLGTGYALLGGRGSAQNYDLWQRIVIPESAQSATLTFRVRIDSAERAPNDTLTVRMFDDDGGTNVSALDTLNSQTNTRDGARGYLKRTFDVTRYAGRAVRVQFLAREDSAVPTSFFIDSVSVTWK